MPNCATLLASFQLTDCFFFFLFSFLSLSLSLSCALSLTPRPTHRFFLSLTIAVSVPEILSTFGVDLEDKSEDPAALGTLIVTIYILGLGLAPILIGPLADLHGRTVMLSITMVCFTAATAAYGAAPSLGALIGLRFLAGCFGGSPAVLGGSIVADMYPEGKRRGPMIVWNAGMVLAPMAGPVVGGALTHALGWRWAIWIPAMTVGEMLRSIAWHRAVLMSLLICCMILADS